VIETETEDEKVAAAGPTGLEIGRDETAEAEAEAETETEESAIEIRKGKEEAGVIHPAAAEVEAGSVLAGHGQGQDRGRGIAAAGRPRPHLGGRKRQRRWRVITARRWQRLSKLERRSRQR